LETQKTQQTRLVGEAERCKVSQVATLSSPSDQPLDETLFLSKDTADYGLFACRFAFRHSHGGIG